MSEQEKHLRQGTKGLAGRVLNQSSIGQPPIGRAATRSALQRVARRSASREPSPPDDPAAQKPTRAASSAKASNRAAQAALGMMGRKPADFDDDALRSWLSGMSNGDLEKLSRLISTARQTDATPPPSSGRRPFEQVACQLEQRGIQFSVNANTVIVNIGDGGAARPPSRGPARDREYRADWGRSWGRVKDFINGH